MGTKYQVFVSSTFEDLKDERDQVIKAVLEMGHIPVGMEMFSAADEEQWKIIARHIDESDYYAVIVAHRYGSITDGMSYTRKEYEYARSKGIPVLGFLIDEAVAWPADRIDKNNDDKLALDEFKARVREKPISTWSSADDLYGRFSVALSKAITSNPREGWVRSSALAGPEVTAELTRLSAENARLRDALTEAMQESEAERASKLRKLDAELRTHQEELHFRYATGDGEWRKAGYVSLRYLFEIVAPTMVVEATVDDISGLLALNLRDDKERRADIVPYNEVRGLFATFMSLDLMQPSERRHSVNDAREYWSLTEFGKEFLRFEKRRRMEEQANSDTNRETS